MRVGLLLVCCAAVVSLVGACAPEPKDATNPGCLTVTSTFRGCTVDINVDSPEKMQSTRQAAISKRTNLMPALTAFCPDSTKNAALRSEDLCVASIDAVMPQARADAAARRAAAEPNAAALRADPRYTPARDKFHTLRIQQSVACETTDAAACRFAQSDANGADAVMRTLLAEYHIDLRDADALRLW
jgi:hypothetical protein